MSVNFWNQQKKSKIKVRLNCSRSPMLKIHTQVCDSNGWVKVWPALQVAKIPENNDFLETHCLQGAVDQVHPLISKIFHLFILIVILIDSLIRNSRCLWLSRIEWVDGNISKPFSSFSFVSSSLNGVEFLATKRKCSAEFLAFLVFSDEAREVSPFFWWE